MGRQEVARALLEAGANPDLRLKDGFLPLLLAIKRNSDDVAKLLVEAGADLSGHDTRGRSVMAAASVIQSDEVVRALIVRGGDVNEPPSLNGSTPLATAAKHGRIRTVELL